jgi:hypothetical protein
MTGNKDLRDPYVYVFSPKQIHTCMYYFQMLPLDPWFCCAPRFLPRCAGACRGRKKSQRPFSLRDRSQRPFSLRHSSVTHNIYIYIYIYIYNLETLWEFRRPKHRSTFLRQHDVTAIAGHWKINIFKSTQCNRTCGTLKNQHVKDNTM